MFYSSSLFWSLLVNLFHSWSKVFCCLDGFVENYGISVIRDDIDCLAQDCSNPSADALELWQSCAKPLA